jgi:hypothetical protein
MSCRVCGLRVKKDDRFVLVGFYPSLWKKSDFAFRFYTGLDCFGELYHETCYLESQVSSENRNKKGDVKA